VPATVRVGNRIRRRHADGNAHPTATGTALHTGSPRPPPGAKAHPETPFTAGMLHVSMTSLTVGYSTSDGSFPNAAAADDGRLTANPSLAPP
jgi:hypothetical protein